MSFLDMVDYMLAFAQGALALLLWHQAEPRMRQARGRGSAACILALGFVLAWSFPLAFSRPLSEVDPLHWQRTVRDLCLVFYAACLYRRAMTLGRRPDLA
jgi:hypothetical protein